MRSRLVPACFAILLGAGMLSGTSALAGPPPAEAAYQKARRAYYGFRNDKERKKFRHNWKNVAAKFEHLVDKFPKSSRVPDALFTAGRLYHDLYLISRVPADLDHSIELFNKLVKDFPEDHLADDAQLFVATAWIEFKKDQKKARQALAYLIEHFPDGDNAPKARRMLEDLGGAAEQKHSGEQTKVKEAEVKPVKQAPSVNSAKHAVLEKIRHWSNPGYTRIALYTRAKVRYKVGRLAANEKQGKPPRLYVDLMACELGDELTRPEPVQDRIVSRVRFAERDDGSLRVVLDLGGENSYRVFPLDTPERVVIDVTRGEGGEDTVAKVIGQKLHVKTGGETHKKPTKTEVARLKKKSKPGVSLSMMAGLKIKCVAIDAGHGGKDPGAIGSSGALEKKIALKIAKRVAKLLKKNLKLDVILTRKGDYFVPLEGRTAIANEHNADLFVSIHLNAHRNRKFRGVETFYLDLTDDRYSIKLAARENATSEKSISDLKYILADLALKSHVDDSIRLSRLVQKSLVGTLRKKYKRIKSLGIKPALFYVLIGARMPSILIETSFITNPLEEKRLKSVAYQKSLAEGIVAGISNFIKERDKFLDP